MVFHKEANKKGLKVLVPVCYGNGSSFYFSLLKVTNWMCVTLRVIWRQAINAVSKNLQFFVKQRRLLYHTVSMKWNIKMETMRSGFVCFLDCELEFQLQTEWVYQFPWKEFTQINIWGENKLFRIYFSSDPEFPLQKAQAKGII